MRFTGHARRWLATAVGAAVLTLVTAPASGAERDRLAGAYLNLHQCVYFALLPNTNTITMVGPGDDGRFRTGTNVSDTADHTLSCGRGDGNYRENVNRSWFTTFDLRTGRYLNLHQCVYYSDSGTDHLTTVIPDTTSGFSAGTNVSDTADTKPSCEPGAEGYRLIPLLSAVKALDLRAGKYLNLEQCVYYFTRFNDHFTTVAPSDDGRFRAGTNVSDTAGAEPSCGAGDGNYEPIPLLSGVRALALT